MRKDWRTYWPINVCPNFLTLTQLFSLSYHPSQSHTTRIHAPLPFVLPPPLPLRRSYAALLIAGVNDALPAFSSRVRRGNRLVLHFPSQLHWVILIAMYDVVCLTLIAFPLIAHWYNRYPSFFFLWNFMCTFWFRINTAFLCFITFVQIYL